MYSRTIMLEDLVSRKRYPEAARVLLDYTKDVREAVIALVNGNKFSEAQRVVECLCFVFHDSRPNRGIINWFTDQPILFRSCLTRNKSCWKMWSIQAH